LGKNRFLGWQLMALVYLATLPAIAFSQGRPDIIWAKGGHSGSVNSVAYSPDGQLLASGSSDETIKIWRQDGTFIRSLAIPLSGNPQLFDVRSVAISPDGTTVAFWAPDVDGRIQLWVRDLRIPQARALPDTVITEHDADGLQVAFSPDGRALVAFLGGKLKRISLDGGSPQTLADASQARGATWGVTYTTT